jgi:hypothetical protein
MGIKNKRAKRLFGCMLGGVIVPFALLACGKKSVIGNSDPDDSRGDDMVVENTDTLEAASPKLPDSTSEADGGKLTSVGGPYGQISVKVPASWNYRAVSIDDDQLMYGLYGLILSPNGAEDGQIELFCTDMFGVCGTGLVQEETTLAGDIARFGTYDEHEHWDFIAFGKERTQVVAQHTNCDSWTDQMWEEALSILDTMHFDTDKTEGGVGKYIPESENDEIAIMMSVKKVSSCGLVVSFRQYDERETGELVYGEGYTLERLNGEVWEAVPMVTDNAGFHDKGYIIPESGESELAINWEWLYGKLSPGIYKITKMVWDSEEEGSKTMIPVYPLSVQFILAGEK